MEPMGTDRGVRPLAASGNDPKSEDEISFLALVNMLLRNRWLLLLLPLTLFAFVVIPSLNRARTYSATGSFVSQASQQSRLGGLASVAAQFGVAVTAESPSEGPAFYAHLLTSPALLDTVVHTRYAVTVDGTRAERDLVTLLAPGSATPALAHDDAVRRLRNLISVARDRETGVITFTVRTPWPEVSQQIARQLIDLVNSFNLNRRRSTAVAQREFAEQRLQQARVELRQAEEALEGFLTRNRLFTNSPELQFQKERLEREVMLRHEVYTSLAQAHEQARIEEVRNLPVITVVQQPGLPLRPNARGTVRRGAVALVIGFVVALLVALGRELMRRSRNYEESELHEYEVLRREAIDDLRHPLRGLAHALIKRQSGSTPRDLPIPAGNGSSRDG